MDRIELDITGTAVGGDGVGRADGGRVTFVPGALAGERVGVELTEERKSFARARLVDIVRPAPGRVRPSCPEVERGCGGCDFSHADADAQFEAKSRMVADSLQRLGRIEQVVDIHHGLALARSGFRTTVRAAVVDGRAGLRRRHSHDWLDVASCAVAHPLVEELLIAGRFGDADEVTIRVGANTGDRMVIVSPAVGDVSVPDDVDVVGVDELLAGRRAWIHEEVGGRRFRISARSFFQTRADGAHALVDTVRAAIVSDDGTSAGRLVDLCAGVGLFSSLVPADSVVAVESNRSAVADARINLADRGGAVEIVPTTFEKWTPSSADVVIADPSRSGLGRVGVASVVATGAQRVALVSCDAASLGRDVGLFAAAGYTARKVTLVDLFPDTSHVEAVTELLRSPQ